MTREAKIGMLTGLFVIVLIGVLLSEYLGGSPTAGNRMAALPQFGETYRRQALDPVGVPGTSGAESTGEMPKAYATERDGSHLQSSGAGLPVLAGDPGMGNGATNSVEKTLQPVQTIQPIQPVPVAAAGLQSGKPGLPVVETLDATKGQATVYVAVGDAPPTMGPTVGLGSALVADRTGAVTAVPKAAPQGEQYAIVKGDTLQKIAHKFYKTSGKDDVRRIVAANPGVLKDESSTLLIGKKLLIPAAPMVAPAKAEMPVVIKAPGTEVAKGAEGAKRDAVIVIRPPGTGDKMDRVKSDATSTSAKTDKKADGATETYVVQKGDTLEKIAKHVSASGYKAVMDKIVALNGMKDQNELHIGEKLKVPAKRI